MYRYVTLHQNVNTCSYCNVCITHIFCKASPIPLKYDNICFIKNCFQNCCMEIHVKIDICTFYLYKIHLGLNNKKCILIISVFMKKISLKEQIKRNLHKIPSFLNTIKEYRNSSFR